MPEGDRMLGRRPLVDDWEAEAERRGLGRRDPRYRYEGGGDPWLAAEAERRGW
jgi:hypothetical protein